MLSEPSSQFLLALSVFILFLSCGKEEEELDNLGGIDTRNYGTVECKLNGKNYKSDLSVGYIDDDLFKDTEALLITAFGYFGPQALLAETSGMGIGFVEERAKVRAGSTMNCSNSVRCPEFILALDNDNDGENDIYYESDDMTITISIANIRDQGRLKANFSGTAVSSETKEEVNITNGVIDVPLQGS